MPLDERSARLNDAASGRAAASSAPRWSIATRIAFRFCFLYFGLYIVLTQMLTSLLFATTNDSGAFEVDNLPPVRAVIVWTAAHVFRIGRKIVTFETGSGDRYYDWIELAWILALAIAGTVVWSILDRKRESYARLYSWFRLFVRFALAATMFTYGAIKVIPLQMPFPPLGSLLEPFGNLSPMGVLWSSIGASQAYEIFAGCAEMLGGILLIVPRTTTFGALVCLADATQVFMLNMTYDVPVKLLSFHMILLSLFLLAFDARRLANLFFLNRAAAPSSEALLFRGGRANRIALVAQIAFGVFLVAANFHVSVQELKAVPYFTSMSRKPPLYGIWNVEQFSIDGQLRPPLLTDTARWRRVVISGSQGILIVGMDDTNQYYFRAIDVAAKTLVLTKSNAKNWKASFSFSHPSPTALVLDGLMDGHKIHAELTAFDLSKFTLFTRGFHWISEFPYNR
jgi:uncharacterized membrane protein YphA (DoxX/SURF4 family)